MHHLQRKIVTSLLTQDTLSFSQLKDDSVENKLHDYHLKQLVRDGIVTKTDDGYKLSEQGRRSALSIIGNFSDRSDLAYSVLLLLVRRQSDKSWLLYKRKIHPLKDKVGFMHVRPSYQEDTLQRAAQQLQIKTGLSGTFVPRGSGFFTVAEGEELQSYTHYQLLVCEDATGDLQQNDDRSEYFWVDEPDFDADHMLPNMAGLVERYMAGEPFFYNDTFEST